MITAVSKKPDQSIDNTSRIATARITTVSIISAENCPLEPGDRFNVLFAHDANLVNILVGTSLCRCRLVEMLESSVPAD